MHRRTFLSLLTTGIGGLAFGHLAGLISPRKAEDKPKEIESPNTAEAVSWTDNRYWVVTGVQARPCSDGSYLVITNYTQIGFGEVEQKC